MPIDVNGLVDTLPGLVWSADADGRADFVNRRWCEYTGLNLEQLLGHGWQLAIHPDDLAAFHKAWSAIRDSAKDGEIEVRLRRFDGKHRWFSLRLSPLSAANAGASNWCGIASDSDEKGAATPDRRLQRFADGLPTQVVFMTPAGELEYVSRETQEFLGQSFEQLQDWSTNGVVHPGDFDSVVQRLTRTITEGAVFDSTARMRRHDGVYVWVRSRMNPSRDAEGNIVRYCSIQSDVDELKHAQDLLSGEVQVLEMVARGRPLPDILNALCRLVEEIAGDCSCSIQLLDEPSGPPGSWSTPIFSGRDEVLGSFSMYRGPITSPTPREKELIDRFTKIAGIAIESANTTSALRTSEAELRRAHTHLTAGQKLSRTGSFTSDLAADEHAWSEEMYRIFDIEPGTVVRLHMLLSRIHPEDMPTVEVVLGGLGTALDFDIIFRLITNGVVKYVHTVGHRVEHIADRPVFLGAMRDVTESKAAEEALNKARAELTHVARVMTLGTLTASIAHEVNQPLAGIINNATVCLHMLAANPPNLDGVRTTAQRMLRDGNRAAEVIRRLRDLFARKQPTTADVDLNDAAREVLTLSSSELHRSRVTLRTDFDASLPAVRGDRVQLQQVILNLILNGADSMREVEDRPRNLLIETRREGANTVRLSVRDAGVGIDPNNVERLFEAFYTTKAQGMGVGLSISRSIIENHEGRLWATANEGPGATFSFSIQSRCD